MILQKAAAAAESAGDRSSEFRDMTVRRRAQASFGAAAARPLRGVRAAPAG
jgi:hypothetical protein